MAEDTNSQTFHFGADAGEFFDTLGQMKDKINSLSDGKSLSALASQFSEIGMILGGVAAAVYTFKAALDLTKEGEQIQAIERQFNSIAENLGISAEKLKQGLEVAGKGLIDDTDLLKAANEAMVKLGSSSERIPEIMNLARQTTAIFGGTAIERFEQITQSIMRQSDRMVASIGIKVKATEAEKKYADSLGVTVASLSEEGKRQAFLNAVLEAGTKSFSGVNENVNLTSKSVQKLDVAWKNFTDSVAVSFTTLSPIFIKIINFFTDMVKGADALFKAARGDSPLIAQMQAMETRADELRKKIATLSTQKISLGDLTAYAELTRTKEELTQIESALKKIKAESGIKEVVAPKQKAPSESGIDYNKRLVEESKFQKSVLQLQQERIAFEEKNAQSEEQYNAAINQKKLLEDQLYAQKVKEIEAERATGKIGSDQKMNQLIDLETKNHNNHLVEIERDAYDKRLDYLKNFEDAQNKAGKGWAAGWAAAGKRAEADLADTAKQSEKIFGIIGTQSKNAFIAMGEGSKDGAQAMRGFMFGALADIAEQEGELHLLAGIASENYKEAAAGAALLVLSGYLRSQASQSSASSGYGSTASSASSSAIGAGPGLSNVTSAPTTTPAAAKNSVSVVINGDYLDTDATRQKLLDVIRSASDATDFKYEFVGSRN